MNYEGQQYSWKQFDEYCRDVLSNLVGVELVGRLRSKSRAAEELNLSLPGLTSRFAATEKILKGPVVESGRTDDLPPLGQRIRALWASIRPSLEDFMEAVAKLQDQRSLRLSIIESVWKSDGDMLQSAYAEQMPGGSIEAVIAEGHLQIESQLREGTVDVGIVSFPPSEAEIAPPIKLHFWRNEPMVAVMEYYAAMRVPNSVQITPDYLAKLDDTFYTMPANTATYHAVNEYLKKHSVRFKYKVPVTNAADALRRILNGNGVSILPEPVVKQAAHNLKVEKFLLNPYFVRPIYAVFRENGLKKALVEAFLKCLSDNKKQAK